MIELEWIPWKAGGGCLRLDLNVNWRYTTLWVYLGSKPGLKFNSEHLVLWAGKWLARWGLHSVTRHGHSQDEHYALGPFKYSAYDTDFGGAEEFKVLGKTVGYYI